MCAVACIVAYKLSQRSVPTNPDEPSAFLPFALLMLKISMWFILAIVGLSLLSTVATWAHYLWLKHTKGASLQLKFETETRDGKNGKLYLHALLAGARRPLLGFVKGRLFYDDYSLTDHFSLLSNQKKEKSLWRAAITGKSRLLLPDIKEYELKGGFIFFEDMLHLFSLAVSQPIAGHFYQQPVLLEEADKDVFPKKTERTDVRIEQMRRVEGEYLNYKDFEAGDDVRRIVWKVYAKNRDLVVRVPEMFEPYASHLLFYASFHAAVKTTWLGEELLKEMLNHYKNNVWTIYDTLARKDWEMRYIADQAFHTPEHFTPAERDARIIANAGWQTDTSLSAYFNARKGAVLCISSLTDPEDLRNILEQCDSGTVVYFIKCSEVFRHAVAWHWFKRLMLLPPDDRLSKMRTRWLLSPIRSSIRKRERLLEEILTKSDVRSGVV